MRQLVDGFHSVILIGNNLDNTEVLIFQGTFKNVFPMTFLFEQRQLGFRDNQMYFQPGLYAASKLHPVISTISSCRQDCLCIINGWWFWVCFCKCIED